MANSTKTTTPTSLVTASPGFVSTMLLQTTNTSEIENNSTATEWGTTISMTVTVTQTDMTSSPSNITRDGKPINNGNGSKGAIIGGVIGGIFGVLVIVVAVILVLKWRKRSRDSSVPALPLPDKDFLDSLHMEQAVHHHRIHQPTESGDVLDPNKQYVNVTAHGEPDEQTDPSVGPDGYLKKMKPKKDKKGKQSTNEKPKRSDSLPQGHAPPPPRGSAQYTEGRVAEKNDGYSDEKVHYANVSGQEKAKDKEKLPKKKGKKNKGSAWETTQKSNLDPANKTAEPEVQETDKSKVYVNVESTTNYYNLKGGEQENSTDRQSAYEYVEHKIDSSLQQDDVYENP